jgi:YD repeat-containing protein
VEAGTTPITQAFTMETETGSRKDASTSPRLRFAVPPDELNRLKGARTRGAPSPFDYDAVGNLVREIDPRVTVRLYAYDARNRRRSATVRLDQVSEPRRNVVTSFRYDRVGNLLEERQPNGNVVRHAYDGSIAW